MTRSRSLAYSAPLAFILSLSCADPARKQAVEELGGEAPGVPEGPLHRPGQPCLVCHGAEGPAESEFTFAGTVYQTRGAALPLHDATVHFIDSTGTQYSVVSNCAGNFWIGGGNFDPVWPVWMKVQLGDEVAEMISGTYREGSCSACHQDPASPSTVGHIYLSTDESFSQEACE